MVFRITCHQINNASNPNDRRFPKIGNASYLSYDPQIMGKEPSRHKTVEHLDAESRYLVHKAKEALTHAYAPYSKFLVGAALLLDDGTVVTGTNQENAAYPSGMCAERVALYSASAQHPGKRIVRLAVAARRKAGKELVPATSCGSCRQVMLEAESVQKKNFPVVMMAAEGDWVVVPAAADLLPYGFDPAQLNHPK
jgi:cytidine deaminase